MPYKTIYKPAGVFLRHAGVVIYFVYKHNDIDNYARFCWYSVNEDSDDDGSLPENFDIRGLKAFRDLHYKGEGNEDTDRRHHKRVLIAAIDSGELTQKGVTK